MWHRLCALAELAEDRLIRVEVGGIAVLATLVGGACRACPPLCPHLAEPLEQSGHCEDGVLTCTKHLWQWDLLSGAALEFAERPLLLYPTRLDGGDVWIEIERELAYEDS
jgi:toluene monooxygenase system ferredoxin subunit